MISVLVLLEEKQKQQQQQGFGPVVHQGNQEYRATVDPSLAAALDVVVAFHMDAPQVALSSWVGLAYDDPEGFLELAFAFAHEDLACIVV
jgi:hypothetical protein